jgi:hypothetical protein
MRWVAVGLVLFGSLDGFGAEAPKKSPVPDETAQRRAQQLIDDVYGKEVAAADTADRARSLAQRMLKTAAESK